MKYKNRILISLILVILITQIGNAAEIDYGIVKAWCNDEPATVKDLNVKIGEPINIKIEVISKINGFVDIQLYEPGITKSFNVISGPSVFDEWISEYNVEPDWKKEYTWTIVPNGEWTSGRAPVNIIVNFNKEINDDLTAQFTIANPYILDEQYSGSTQKPTPDPKSTDQPPSSEGSPGFGVVAALVGVAAVVLIMKKER
jgi:sarcinarray family protein